jgi:CRISPR-associated endonuclease Csn1
MGYVFAIDLGVKSVGLAALELDAEGAEVGIRHGGAMVFPDPVADVDAATQARTTFLADRGLKRRTRRNLRRKAQRRNLVQRTLVAHGLLPKDLDERQTFLNAHKLNGSYHHPYALRARGLDGPLEPHELGKALYHIACRRGFLSTRDLMRLGLTVEVELEDPDEDHATEPARDNKDEDRKLVLGQIKRTRAEIGESGFRTLGELLARRVEERTPVRGTTKKERLDRRKKEGVARPEGFRAERKMYEDEFDALWRAQERHHPDVLTLNLRDKLHRAIFHQRQLRPQTDKKGRCSFHPQHRRCARAMLVAQRFVILQYLHSLELVPQAGEFSRPLTRHERDTLFQALQAHDELTWTEAKRLLGLPHARFSDEPASAKKSKAAVRGRRVLTGNRTAAKIRAVLGERYDGLTDTQQDQLVTELLTIRTPSAKLRRLTGHWGLDAPSAVRLITTELPDGYMQLCSKVLRKLERAMREAPERLTYDRACAACGYDHTKTKTPEDRLPLESLRNPLVQRSCRQALRAIEAAIREWGPPAVIRVELPRDLSRSNQSREEMWREQERRQQERRAAVQLLRDAGLPARNSDILKVRLWQEAGNMLPYEPERGAISLQELIEGDIEIDHIVPLSHACDDSWGNKTICSREFNIHHKGARTPFEALRDDPERWNRVKLQVSSLKGMNRGKRARILAETRPEGGFTGRHLSATSYIVRVVRDEIARRYPEVPVQVTTGGATALLRKYWGFDGILGESETAKERGRKIAEGELRAQIEKNRDDHRHHALDAIMTAMVTPTHLKRLSDFFRTTEERAQAEGIELDRALRKGLGQLKLPPPWEGFREEVIRAVENASISYKPNRGVQGPLHKATSKLEHAPPRTEIHEALRAAGWSPGLPYPRFVQAGTRLVEFQGDRVVRAWKTESNHHVAIYERVNRNRKGEFERIAKVVTMMEASRRSKTGDLFTAPMLGYRQVMCLCKDDIVEWTGERPGLRRVSKIWQVSDTMAGIVLLPLQMAIAPRGRDEAPWLSRAQASLHLIRRRVVLDPLGRIVFSEPATPDD